MYRRTAQVEKQFSLCGGAFRETTINNKLNCLLNGNILQSPSNWHVSPSRLVCCCISRIMRSREYHVKAMHRAWYNIPSKCTVRGLQGVVLGNSVAGYTTRRGTKCLHNMLAASEFVRLIPFVCSTRLSTTSYTCSFAAG